MTFQNVSLIKQHSSERTVNCIAVYVILNNVCHFRTARIKTFEKLKTKGRKQFRAWTVTPNLAKHRALLVGDTFKIILIKYGINQQGLVV